MTDREIPPLRLFLAKAVIVTLAAIIVLFAASFIAEEFTTKQTEQMAILMGSPDSWAIMERKLHKLADDPDITPEGKQKVIEALRRISAVKLP